MHWATFHAGPHTQPAQSRQSCSTGNTKQAPAAVTSRFAERLKLSEIFHCILKILCVLHIPAPTSFSLLADRADMLSPYGRFLSRLSLWENPQHTRDIFQFSSVSMVSLEGVPGGSGIGSWIICAETDVPYVPAVCGPQTANPRSIFCTTGVSQGVFTPPLLPQSADAVVFSILSEPSFWKH